jgi:hypothetical protein
MPQPGVPTRSAITPALALALALVSGALVGACRRQATVVEDPDDAPIEVTREEVDPPAVCAAGCRRLERCVPELASGADGDPTIIAKRLAAECEGACSDFADRDSSLALRDCLELDSCEAYWGCVGTSTVRPWLAAVAPVGERTCANLCSQASACAIAKVCETEDKRPRPGKPKPKPKPTPEGSQAGEGGEEQLVDPVCMRDQALRDELEERCLLQCEATAEDSRARTELIGCIDHGSCGGLLHCLDTWTETDYSDEVGPTPGISPTCDSFCTRAILCGAEEEQVELEPEELDELKQTMTSTYVECAVQCGTDLETGGEAARAAFDACTAVETCEEFTTCADEV